MLGYLIGVQGRVKQALKTLKHPHLWRPPKRTSNPKTEIFFWLGTRRRAESVEDLNTSLAAAAGELWPNKYRPIHWPVRSLKGTLKVPRALLLKNFAIL